MRASFYVLALLVVSCKEKTTEPAVPPLPVVVDAARATPTPAPPSKPTSPRITSPLPERGPHPDYPTPAAAGTDKIFLLEEPDRGPKPPLMYELPAGITWTEHASCTVEANRPTCAGVRGKRLHGWRLGKKGTELVVVEERRGDHVESVHVYVQDHGTPKQHLTLDDAGRVLRTAMPLTPGRWSARERGGGNGLPGCGSIAVELDKAGRSVVETCLQWSGQPMRNTEGVAKTTHKRDRPGFVIEEASFGLDGAAAVATDGVHRTVYERDGDGRERVRRFFGVDGKPTASVRGCHGRRSDYDDRGLLSRTTCLGADDKPSNDSTRAAVVEYAYDASGCRIRERKESAPGTPDPLHEGSDYVVDEHCRATSETCVKADGNRRACGIDAPARYDYKYDAHGRRISTSSYAVDGSPSQHPSWAAFEIREELDDLDRTIASSCFDAGGVAIECSHFGFHRKVATYDDAGRLVLEHYFDPAGKPTTNLGAASRRYTYDNYDHMFEGRGFDAGGNAIESLGMAVQRQLYDPAHREFAKILLDKAGKPAAYTGCFGGIHCPTGSWHALKLVRSADGELKKQQFFDAAGQLIETQDCSKVRCLE
ncbi:MAG: hypothetical protein ABI867_33740 [Kofleriaceae bacterium]